MFDFSIFWELLQNSRTKCTHLQQLLNHKTIKRLRPWFFCESTVPEIEEYKTSIPWTFNKEIEKLPFLPSKMGGRLIYGIDLYTGKYGSYFLVLVSVSKLLMSFVVFFIFSPPNLDRYSLHYRLCNGWTRKAWTEVLGGPQVCTVHCNLQSLFARSCVIQVQVTLAMWTVMILRLYTCHWYTGLMQFWKKKGYSLNFL